MFVRVVVLFGVVASAATGCSGPDPGVVMFISQPPAGGDDTGEDEGEGEDPAPAPSGTGTATGGAVNAVFANEVFPSVNPTCGSCHLAGTGGAAVFFGADAAATYPLFKGQGFDKAGSLFLTKGAHTGPDLTVEQKTLMDKWIAAEAGG